MAQHDYVIDNQTAPNFRSDLNNALLAIASTNSGASAPSTTYANMMWYDTTNNILKMRNEANSAWINLGTLNQSTGQFEVANLTTLTQADWEAGIVTTEALVSPVKVKAQIVSTLNASGSAPVYACRAWVNFNGTGTVAIRASGNVTSITDNGTGDYTVNFTTAMPDVNYAVTGFCNFGPSGAPAGLLSAGSGFAPAVGSVRISTANSTDGTPQNAQHVHVAIFR